MSSKFYNTLKCHGFKGETPVITVSDGGLTYSPEYCEWLRYFPVEDLAERWEWQEVAGVDFDKPLGIDIQFVSTKDAKIVNMMQGMNQLLKDMLDIPSGRVIGGHYQCVGYCESEFDGEIKYTIYNM